MRYYGAKPALSVAIMGGAFITASGQFLPGQPVGNKDMADPIGRLSLQAERLGRLTLRQNGIKSRHYAIRPGGTEDCLPADVGGRA